MASKISGTMATEIQLNLLARYQRNAWLNITEMGGTMASELSNLEMCQAVNIQELVVLIVLLEL